MKRLYLVRHAKSSWKDPSLADFDRPLNKRGERDAPVMAKRVKEAQAQPDRLISSPAKRAASTAKIFAQELDIPETQMVFEKVLYEAGVMPFLDVLHQVDEAYQQVMLFGHNPGITMLAEFLTGTTLENIPTCGIVCLDLLSWQHLEKGTGRLIFFDFPKKPH